MNRRVEDNTGGIYEVIIDENECHVFLSLYSLQLRKEYDRCVGEANCRIISPKEIVFENMSIRDDANPQYDINFKRFEGTLSVTPINPRKKELNFQGIGLGTALLEFIICYARDNGFKRIYGSVVKKDSNKRPYLVDWYMKHGFKKSGPYPGCIESAVWIVYDIA